jgi:hypothetical protein
MLSAISEDIRVVGDNPHPERSSALGNFLTDAAKAGDAKCLAVKFGAE